MGLDAMHDLNFHHQDKNKGRVKMGDCVFKCDPAGVYVGTKVLPVSMHACSFTYASGGSFWGRTCNKYRATSEKYHVTAITLDSQTLTDGACCTVR